MYLIKIKSNFVPQFYEKEAWETYKTVCGVDEVGRGCLIGPVVTAAVILKPHSHHELLRDSKLLTPHQRRIAYIWLKDHSVFALSFMHHTIIDACNIYQATLKAMKRSVTQLLTTHTPLPGAILVDNMPLAVDEFAIPVISFSFGERQSASIAAASIIAKVTRDALMERLEVLLPGYGLAQHKGYGTKKHKEALHTLGTTILHRHSFLHFLTPNVRNTV
jgi:ribonuclease HII